jgi:lipoate-protein ligase B
MLIYDLGTIDYEAAFALQLRAQKAVQDGCEDCLFVLEHTPTVTLGRNQGRAILPAATELERCRAQVVKSSRGGNITCHFPGQLVAYPMVNLKKRPGGLRRFVHDLEESIITTLAALGLNSERRPGFPGVWVGMKKIASLGLAFSRHVSIHGLAINIQREMPLFELIPPCGTPWVKAVSVAEELNRPPVDMREAKPLFLKSFQAVFADLMTIEDIERTENLEELHRDLTAWPIFPEA